LEEIIKIVDKWNWYKELIKHNCPERLLKIAFCLADYIHQTCTIGKCIDKKDKKCDRYGWAYPTVEQIKEYTGKSESKISEYTKELAEEGWIIKEIIQRQTGRKTFYQLSIGKYFSTNKKRGRTDNLVQFATPAVRNLQLPQNGIGNSRKKESATPAVRDDKHKLETLIEASTKTLTIRKNIDKKMITISDLCNSKNLLSVAQRNNVVVAISPALTTILYFDFNDLTLNRQTFTPQLPQLGSCEKLRK